MAQPITKIYLHWSATDYNWASPGTYHTVVQGNGAVRRLAGYDQPLQGHTHGRNSHAVSLCLACMGGNGWASYPPRREQIDSLCREVANIAYRLGWTPEQVSIQRILTQAEAAANRDFPLEAARQVSGWSKPTSTVQAEEYGRRARLLGLPHENFGPTAWFDNWPTGYQERWGLWQLSPSDRPGEGGFRLREMIRQYLQQAAIDARRSPRLREVNLYINNRLVDRAWILPDNRAYAQLLTLTTAYGIATTWSVAKGYANLKTTQYQVKYLAAAPIFLGFPSVDVYLNRPEDALEVAIVDSQVLTRPFMQGLVMDNALWVSLADFCQELGIAIRVASDLSIYLGVSEPPPPPPPPTPTPAAPARSSDVLRICDIYLGETTFLSKGYLLADNRCYVKLANLSTAYSFRLTWNGRRRYLNVVSNRLQANYLEDAPPVSGYAVVPVFLNRPEDAQGNPIDSPQAPARPFMQGIIMENSAFVAIAEFCRELGITIRVDPDFSIHLGSIPQPSIPQPLTSSSGNTSSGNRMSVMPPYIVTPPPPTPPTSPPPTPPASPPPTPPTSPPPTPPTSPPPTPPTSPPPTPPTSPPPTPPTSQPQYVEYVVQPGDTLVGIARRIMGPTGDWRVIAQINGVSDPSQLQIGQVLKVPTDGNPSQPSEQPTPPPRVDVPITDTYTTYVVKAGDTLTNIASTLLGASGAWQLIGILNNISNVAQVTVGQALRIPPRQFTVPTVLNTLQGRRQPGYEVVSFRVDREVVYADRPGGQPSERVGRIYEKGLYRGGTQNPQTFIARASTQLRSLKLSDSEVKVITAVAENEGNLDAINTWDNSFLSFGIFQWTAGAENSPGELGALLELLKRQAPTVFQHYFGQFGLDVQPQEGSDTGWITLNGQRLMSTAQKSVLRQPIWAYRFAIAGADTVVQSVQILHAINRLDRFYFSPQRDLQNIPLSRLFTSEFGVALLLDNHVNRPGYVVSCVAEALKQQNISASQLANGTEADEQRVIDRYLVIRQTYGKYPMTDALERGNRARERVSQGLLSSRRNSFVSNRSSR